MSNLWLGHSFDTTLSISITRKLFQLCLIPSFSITRHGGFRRREWDPFGVIPTSQNSPQRPSNCSMERTLCKVSGDDCCKIDEKLEDVSKPPFLQVTNGLPQGMRGAICFTALTPCYRGILTYREDTKKLVEGQFSLSSPDRSSAIYHIKEGLGGISTRF